VSTFPPLTFPNWTRPAVIHEANRLLHGLAGEENSAKALEILCRLTSDPLMQSVWRELFKRKRTNHKATEQYFYAASVTNASNAVKLRHQASELRKAGGAHSESDAGWRQSAERLEWFFQTNGGISGCARKHTGLHARRKAPSMMITGGAGCRKMTGKANS
jgi:hypothetical protein